MPFQFDVFNKKIHVLPGTDFISASGVLDAYQKWLVNYPESRNADVIMNLAGGIKTVGDQRTPIILILAPGVKMVLDAAEMQGMMIPLNSQIISKTDGLNFWEIIGDGMAIVPGYGNVTTFVQDSNAGEVSGGAFDPDAIFSHKKWGELMAKLNATQATVNVSTSAVSINGLTEQDVTIIQGDDWELEVNFNVPEGAEIEFLLQDESRYALPIVGTSTDKSDGSGFILSLSAQQTSGLRFGGYSYNVSWILAEEKEQILRGAAKIQHSVLSEGRSVPDA